MSPDDWLKIISMIIAFGYYGTGIYLIRNDEFMIQHFCKMMDEPSVWVTARMWVVFWTIFTCWPLKLLWNVLVRIVNKLQEVK